MRGQADLRGEVAGGIWTGRRNLEKKRGEAFLRRPDLLTATLRDIEALGVAGESDLVGLLYLVGTSRKLARPMSAILRAASGAGKSTLVEVVERLMPPEDVVSLSGLSPHALYYMDRTALSHRILVIEERAGVGEADYGLRLLQSKGSLRRAVVVKDPQTGRSRTVRIEVDGPVAVMETTTGAVNPENASRSFLLYPDESGAQTKRVMAVQRRRYLEDGPKREAEAAEIEERHHAAQRLLEPAPVVIPFAERVEFPAPTLRARREHARFWSLVEASAFLHQRQRTRRRLSGGDGARTEAIVATIDDYEIAYRVTERLLAPALMELPAPALDLLAQARDLATERAGGGLVAAEVAFTRRTLADRMGWSLSQVRGYLSALVEAEFVEAVGGVRRGVRAEYRLTPEGVAGTGMLARALALPSPETLREAGSR